jgi:uncharacterized Zn finger protein (UPF0148 family)
MKDGDKCPQCRQGLLVKTDIGLSCSTCGHDIELAEVVAANASRTKIEEYEWRPKTIKITLDEPEKAEEFLRGCILARQNNNSEYFVDLIDAVNNLLQPWRAAVQRDALRRRDG